MLDLKELKELEANVRNNYVLGINDLEVEDGHTFSEINGYLCGGDIEGLLEEESQEILFVESGISLNFECENHYILRQNNKTYKVGKVIGKEGCSIPSEHFNFNNME